MAINYDALMSYQIPEVRQAVTARDAAFYALSCGLGMDPLDEAQLDFIDFHRTLKILPSMPVVLGNPHGFLETPAHGINYVQVVHGEQTVENFAPLPLGGEVVGRSRIVSLIDKGQGRGALMVLARDLHNAANNELLASARATIFLRADGGFGGPTGPLQPVPPAHKLPERAPDTEINLPTRPEQALYYRFNGDENPLHAAPKFAAMAGFARPILHGLCTFGVATHALLQAVCGYEPARLKKFGCRFSAPVFPGETIRTEIWYDGSFRARVVERDSVVVTHGFFELV